MGPGTQHKPDTERHKNGTPLTPSGTLMVSGNMKEMDPRWVVGVSMLGYGCSLAVGVGIPIPVLDAEMAAYTGVSDEDLFTQVIDYGNDYPKGEGKSLAQVSYADLKKGMIRVNGQEIPSIPISSHKRSLEIANILKEWVEKGEFLLTQPLETLPA